MIKFRTEVTYRDDKKKVFDGTDHPNIGPQYLIIFKSTTERIYIPQEGIKQIKIKDYWKHE